MGFDVGGRCACVRADLLVAVVGQSVAGLSLGVEQGPPALAVDAAGEAGDERFAVLGDDEGVAFGELSDFGAGEDGDVLAGDGPAGAAVLVGGAGDPDRVRGGRRSPG